MSPARLRVRGEALAAPLPGLIARGGRLAASVAAGAHGRRRPGPGDAFWQYRPAEIHEARRIDWRRSARGDTHFVQEKEWDVAQSVRLWTARGASMDFASQGVRKADRAADLAMALAVLLLRGGERVGLWRGAVRGGAAALEPLARGLLGPESPLGSGQPERHSHAVFFGDFLGETAPLEAALAQARGLGLRGALVQILDPAEADFPFRGRSIFETPGGDLRHETQSAAALRPRYLARLAARQEALRALAARSGWLFHTHITDRPASAALLWLWHGLGGRA